MTDVVNSLEATARTWASAGYLVAFGIARALSELGVAPAVAYQLLLATAIFDARRLWEGA